MQSESPEQLVPGRWHSVRAAAGTQRDLYVLDRDTNVYRVGVIAGTYGDSLGDGFDGDWLVMVDDRPFVFNGPAATAAGRIFTIEDRALYSIDPASGAYERLDNSWDTRQLIGLGDQLFAWEADNALYRVDPATGSATPLCNTWPHVGGVATAIGRLYAVDGGILYEVDPSTGACTAISDRLHTRLLAGAGSSIYSFERGGDLFRIGVG
jgi:hypothetical protein